MADSPLSSLAQFLASRKGKQDATPSVGPAPEKPEIPSSVAPPPKPLEYSQKYKPSFARRALGAWAEEAFRDTGHVGRVTVERVRGDHLTGSMTTTRTRAASGSSERVSISQPGPTPNEPVLGPMKTIKDVSTQVIRLDKEVRDWGNYVKTEFGKVRTDIKGVLGVAQKAQEDVDRIKKDLSEETFRKRVNDARIKNRDGKAMSLEDVRSDPGSVHDSQKGLVEELLDELGKWGTAAAAGGAGAALQRILNKFRGRTPKAAEVAKPVEPPKTETPRVGKGLVEDLEGKASDAMKWVRGKAGSIPRSKFLMEGLKGGLVGGAIQYGGEYLMDKAFGTPEENYQRDVEKYGKQKANELYAVRTGNPLSGFNRLLHGHSYYGGDVDPDFLTETKGDKKEDKPEGDVVIESKKNVSIKSVQDISVEARNEITIKARVITLDADRLELKGGIKLPGQPDQKKPDSGTGTPGNLSSRDQRYEEYVQKYGKEKADQLMAVQEDRWTDPMHWVRKLNPFSGGSDRATATPGSGSGLQPAGQAGGKASAAIKQFQGGSGSSAAVDLALQEEGLHERKDRAAIVEYLKNGGVNLDPATTAWCAAFVNSTLAQTGVKGTGSMAAGSFQNWGAASDAEHVKKGDVLVNKDYSPRTGMTGSHVGLATGNVHRDDQGNVTEMEMISGNESDMVKKSWERVGRWNVRTATEREMIARQEQSQPGNVQASSLNRGAFEKTFSGTALGNKYDQVVEAANRNGLPPSLLASVMAHETGKGSVLTGNNPAGLMDPSTNWSTKQQFSTLDAGIEKAAANLKKRWTEAGGDLSKLAAKYAPVGAANDPRGLNSGWLPGVSGFLRKFEDGLPADVSQTQPQTVTVPDSLKDKFDTSKWSEKDAAWFAGGSKPQEPEAERVPDKDATPVGKPPEIASVETHNFSVDSDASDDLERAFKTVDERKKQSDADPTRQEIQPGTSVDTDSANDLARAFTDAEVAKTDFSQSVPMPDPVVKSGEEITQEVKDSTPSVRGPTTESKSDTGSQGSSSSPGSNRRVSMPVHHPESEAPRPGTDGYGDQQTNPDDCGICSMSI